MVVGTRRFGVGLVGLQPGRSWSAIAHVPALRALPGDFQIVGVANSSPQSAEAAARATGIPRAFADLEGLLAAPEVDIVAVTVKVGHHFEIVSKAIEAGKHVYCEWALGLDLGEARQLADLARKKGIVAVIGTQALFAPQIQHLRQLIADGYAGEVLSSTLVASGGSWGGEIAQANAYSADRSNGVTLLTIPFAHAFAAVQSVLGEVVELSATLANRRTSTRIIETGEVIALTSPDQVLVQATLAGGAVIAAHYRGGRSRGTGFLWEINGTDGELQVTAPSGHAQMAPLSLAGASGDETTLTPMAVPPALIAGRPDSARAGNVAQVYARLAADLRDGTRTAPTFDDAVGLHRLIAAIEASAETGTRVSPAAL